MGIRYLTTTETQGTQLAGTDGQGYPVGVAPGPIGPTPQQLQTTFVWQPGGPGGGNTYPDFNALYLALDGACPASAKGTRPPSTILADGSFVSPAPISMPVRTGGGAYNLNNTTWLGVADPVTGSAGTEIVLSDGVTIDGGFPTANLMMSFRGDVEFTNNTTNDVITCSGPNQVVVLNQEQNTNIQSDALGGRMLKVTNGRGFVLMMGDSTLGDGAHCALESVAPGAALVQAFGNSYVGAGAVLGANSAVFWDMASPGAQGTGVAVTSVQYADGSVALANGANQDVVVALGPGAPVRSRMFLRIDGPTAAYSIGGVACDGGNRGGQRVTFWSAVGVPLTVNFADAGSAAANRIYNPTMGPVFIGNSYSNFTVQYDSNLPGWILVDYVSDESIASNRVQGTTENAVANSPVLSPTIAFTCLGPKKIAHVEVSAYPINTSGTLDDTTTMTLLLDGAPVVGAPTPEGSCFNNAPLTNPMATTLQMTWDVTFPDNAPHTLGIEVVTGAATKVSLGPGTIFAYEVP